MVRNGQVWSGEKLALSFSPKGHLCFGAVQVRKKVKKKSGKSHLCLDDGSGGIMVLG